MDSVHESYSGAVVETGALRVLAACSKDLYWEGCSGMGKSFFLTRIFKKTYFCKALESDIINFLEVLHVCMVAGKKKKKKEGL